VGRFIQTYHGFLSSFVIGAAGLIATSIWQFRQAEIASRQAAAQQKVAETQADNLWKIERAEILAKNLQTLSLQGSNNVEQRYGVLLSLTRGNILDPELAVSYALELGKDSPEYMRSVLTNASGKDYWRLARAFEPTCDQRYGVTRNIEACAVDKLADRSAAIAEMISDELQAAFAVGTLGPAAILADEHQVQSQAVRLCWFFSPALARLYQRRQWNNIDRFEGSSPGAKLVSALALAKARTGEMVSNEEGRMLEKFFAQRRQWLTQYLVGPSCDSDCRSKLVDVMVTSYAEAEGDYDPPMRSLLQQPRSQSGAVVSTLHARLLWCQVDGEDLVPLRDRVLVPEAMAQLGKGKGREETAQDFIDLLALVPSPKDNPALAQWKVFIATLEKPTNAKLLKTFNERRAAAVRERASPPSAMKRINFCVPETTRDASSPPRKTGS
jgi:hypothetical protein